MRAAELAKMAEPKPKNLRVAQRREAVRITVPHFDVCLWSPRDGMSVAETTKLINLSATGALVQARHSYTPGNRVQCSFDLTGAGHFSLPAHIVRCMVKEKMSDRFLVAVQFKAPPQTEELLVRWIFRWMAHQHRLVR